MNKLSILFRLFSTCIFLTTLSLEAVSQNENGSCKEINKEIYSYKKKDLRVEYIQDDSLVYTYVFYKQQDDIHSLQLKRKGADTLATNTYFFLGGSIAKIIISRWSRGKPLRQSTYHFKNELLVCKKEKGLVINDFKIYLLEGYAYLKKAKELLDKKIE